MKDRAETLNAWLLQFFPQFSLQLMAHDASFRRYHRVRAEDECFVVMDAPPEKERVHVFVELALQLDAANILVPKIFASDAQLGFVLMSDFGDEVFYRSVLEQPKQSLYEDALQTLLKMQTSPLLNTLPLAHFTQNIITQELHLWDEWFLQKFLKTKSRYDDLEDFFDCLVDGLIEQPFVFMHRDFHSKNLMQLSAGNLGVLDFQDAFLGPVTYDVVSLLRDCYVSLPPQMVQTLALNFKAQQPLLSVYSDAQFMKWFDYTGLQRHLKALMTFTRKAIRDGHENYLQYLPRTSQYIVNTCDKYPELNAFSRYFKKQVALCVA